MGNALQAENNITGAVQFYNYAMVLNPNFTEAFHGLLIVKCYQQRIKSEKSRKGVSSMCIVH